MYYVYYHDGYADNGDIGLEKFEEMDKVIKFIENRIVADPIERTKDMYTVIDGDEYEIEIVETVKSIRLRMKD